MLRVSSQINSESVNLSAVMTGDDAGDIQYGAQLVAIAEAVVSRDPSQIRVAREALLETAGAAVLVDAVGVASNFQRMVRIADSTGIVLGDFESTTEDIRESLGINAFSKFGVSNAPNASAR